jgi:dihydrofolate reductase
MTVTLVAAVARNGVIGKDGRLPWRLPGEQAMFKATTMGHVLVMGRRTYESIGRPLPGRTTVVITTNLDWKPAQGPSDEVRVAPSVEAALQVAGEIDDQVYVVGGAQVYAACLPHVDELLITEVDAEPDGDTVFPAIDWTKWVEVSREHHDGWTVARFTRATGAEGYRDAHGNSV